MKRVVTYDDRLRPKPLEPLPSGLLVPGSIDLARQPEIRNPDGTTSTVRSMSFSRGGREILIPTVGPDRILSEDEAIRQYDRTGKHLGIFSSPELATEYAKRLHDMYADGTIKMIRRK